MDRLWRTLSLLFGLVSCSHPFIPPSVLEVTVRPGDNITLYCDCKVDLGVYIVWYRNCSHQNQPSLLLDFNTEFQTFHQNFPRYDFIKNFSSDSYDLMIRNVTVSDEGLYYCGTKETKVEKQEIITQKEIYRHGNISTKITVNGNTEFHQKERFPRYDFIKNFSSDSYNLMIRNVTVSDEGLYYCGTKETKVEKQEIITQKEIYRHGNIKTKITVNVPNSQQDCILCWKLLVSLCPTVSFLSALISSLLVHLLCRKTAKTSQEDENREPEETQGEDVCYAALEICPVSKRSKRKRTIQRSDFSTYSAVKTSRV